MRIALGQFNAVVGDLVGNARVMREYYERSVGQGTDVLLFPELSVCGYPPEDLLHKKHFLRECYRVVEQLAKDCGKMTVLVGFPENAGKDSYNAMAVLRGGEVETIYRKGKLPNYGVFDERRYFQPGNRPVVIEAKGLRIGLTICRDIWQMDWLKGFLRNSGRIDLVVNMSASPFHLGKISKFKIRD